MDLPELIRRRFNASAASYAQMAFLSDKIAENLLARMALLTATPKRLVDLGCGPGRQYAMLHKQFPDSMLISVDVSAKMLAQSPQPEYRLQADLHQLPFLSGSASMIFSSLLLPWCDPDIFLKTCFDLLEPEGHLFFSTLGPDTLKELREAWMTLGFQPQVNDFEDMHITGDRLLAQKFSEPVMDRSTITVKYPDVYSLLSDLKASGSTFLGYPQYHGLLTPKTLKALEAAYPRAEDGSLLASFEIVYGHACRPARKVYQTAEGDIRYPVEHIK